MTQNEASRIEPLSEPYSVEVNRQLEAMMPPGVPPIRLFRTFAKNLPMSAALRAWGGYELSSELSLTLRDREIVIDRVCARCGCEYEWGVHIAFFAERAGLTYDEVRSLTHGDASDPCWTDVRDRLLIEVVDQLHDRAQIADDLWERLQQELSEAQALDLFLLAGWYHAISYAANASMVAYEENAPRFSDYKGDTQAAGK